MQRTDCAQSCKISILPPPFQRPYTKQCPIVLVGPPQEVHSILQIVPLVILYGPNNRGRSASVPSRARVASFMSEYLMDLLLLAMSAITI
jgi:hypothetical protein